MKYPDLRGWLLNWMDSIPDEPVPLEISKGEYTEDVRITIQVIIATLDKLVKDKPTKPTRYMMDKKYKLLKVKAAIEKEQHDIAHYKKNEITNENE